MKLHNLFLSYFLGQQELVSTAELRSIGPSTQMIMMMIMKIFWNFMVMKVNNKYFMTCTRRQSDTWLERKRYEKKDVNRNQHCV